MSELIKTIEEYIIHHFSEEEKYMLDKDYPDYQAHRSAHANFMKEFLEIKVEYHLKDESSKIGEKLDFLLNEWWVNHLSTLDKKPGEYPVARGAR